MNLSPHRIAAQLDIQEQQRLMAAARANARPINFHYGWLGDDRGFNSIFAMWLALNKSEVVEHLTFTVPLAPPEPILVVATPYGSIAIMEAFSGLTSESLGFMCQANKSLLKAADNFPVWPDSKQLEALLSKRLLNPTIN